MFEHRNPSLGIFLCLRLHCEAKCGHSFFVPVEGDAANPLCECFKLLLWGTLQNWSLHCVWECVWARQKNRASQPYLYPIFCLHTCMRGSLLSWCISFHSTLNQYELFRYRLVSFSICGHVYTYSFFKLFVWIGLLFLLVAVEEKGQGVKSRATTSFNPHWSTTMFIPLL